MRKLKLRIEELRVVSLETDAVRETRGTVRAHAETEALRCTLWCDGVTMGVSDCMDCSGPLIVQFTVDFC